MVQKLLTQCDFQIKGTRTSLPWPTPTPQMRDFVACDQIMQRPLWMSNLKVTMLSDKLDGWLILPPKLTYSLSRKTVNTRENFWNVYCFATNQMRDETAKDNGQTAAGISHDLIRNNEPALSFARNLQFLLCISLKKLFCNTKQY